MDIRLQVFEYYADYNNYLRKSFRFVVVDFSKSKSYPQNFVCVLPVNLGVGKSDSVFLHVFKDKSFEQAKALLKAAWEREDDSEVKAEIERRLWVLEPKTVNQIKRALDSSSPQACLSFPGIDKLAKCASQQTLFQLDCNQLLEKTRARE